MDIFSLSNKTAIVTGASKGLGRAMAFGLAQAGANIAIIDILPFGSAVKKIQHIGVKAMGIKVDVSDEAGVKSAIELIKHNFGKIDILINNAGIFSPTLTESINQEDWDRIIRINLKGQMICAKEIGKDMIKQKSGKIINIASVAGKFAFSQAAAYNASKAGVILLTKTLAIDLAKYNVRVNAICPGCFKTSMTKDFLKHKDFIQMIKSRVPVGRCGKPEEIVGAAVFLASESSNYMTGHALVVDGGWTAGL